MPSEPIPDTLICRWASDWDAKIASWIAAGPSDMGLPHLLEAYKANGAETTLDLNALPEPYVGDPLAENFDAVMLTLNPGESGLRQMHPDGELVREIRQDLYYAGAKHYLLKETRAWWSERAAWPARLLGDRGGGGIVGIDLVPWHSKRWGTLNLDGNQPVLSYLKDNVLTPATRISDKSRLTRISGLGVPILLAVGSQHLSWLAALDFELRAEHDHKTSCPEWPGRKDGAPSKRAIRLFFANDRSVAVLQTGARGTFKVPHVDFDPIVRRMLRL